MQKNDVELIHRILDGDDTAFTELVAKYQKSVHALVWRKIGDFHIAEEITQDTFLKAYQKLSTLKRPQRFASWLYVIASRRCLAWQRKKRILTKSLEETSSAQIEKATYSQYVVNENTRITAETQRDVVKKLLAKLPESERTIITLHYFSEMSSSEIGAFLGVSANTIRSRLRRAQQRLQKEETMIREALNHFKLSPNLTDNIMQDISRLKPTPSASKPLVPWAVAAASAILIMVMLGLGSQNLIRFQQPYSLEAQAEMTVELVDAPVVLNIDTNPDVRNQLGNTNALGISENVGQKPDEVLLAAAESEEEDKVSTPKQQWIQAEPIIGSAVENLFATEEGELYTVLDAHVYKWQNNSTGWQQLSGDIRDYHDRLNETTLVTDVPIGKWDNTLYILLENLLLASKDDGKTWDLVHAWPPEYSFPRQLVFTKHAYWAIFSKSAFRSKDKGKTWQDVDNDELFRGYIFFKAIQNKVFVGTYTGLYRWKTGSWERVELPVPEALIVAKTASTKNRLYVLAGLGWEFYDDKAVREGRQRTWWIFRSDDLGNSWKDITPTNAWPLKAKSPDIQLVAAGETIMLMGRGMVRSTDGGDTWLPPQAPHTFPIGVKSHWPSVALNEHVFYTVGRGLHRSTDGGKSWSKVNITSNRRWGGIQNLISYKRNERMPSMQPTLYGLANGIVKTTDKGKSWNHIQVDMPMDTSVREDQPRIMQIVESDGVIYAKGNSDYPFGEMNFYRESEDGDTLLPIKGVPTLDSRKIRDYLRKAQNPSVKELQENCPGATLYYENLLKILNDPQTNQQLKDRIIRIEFQGSYAVSGGTFYIECNQKLLRWEPGETEWQDIGQEETSPGRGSVLQLAVSGDTIYVGKRDGHLVVSFDRGDNWIDLTPALPFPIRIFKKIVVAESAVYVATDAGTLRSDDGRNWRVVADAAGTNLIMEELAVDGTTLYGITKDTGIYRLKGDSDAWEQIISEIPESATVNIAYSGTSLAVIGNTLYLGTQYDGMFHFNLEE